MKRALVFLFSFLWTLSATAGPAVPEICLHFKMPVIFGYDMFSLPSECFQLESLADEAGRLPEPGEPLQCFGPYVPDYADEWETMSFELESWQIDQLGFFLFNSQRNVLDYAEQYLWPLTVVHGVNYMRPPCGGSATCIDTLETRVECYIEKTDCAMDGPDYGGTVLQTFLLTCDADRACSAWGLDPAECCQIVE